MLRYFLFRISYCRHNYRKFQTCNIIQFNLDGHIIQVMNAMKMIDLLQASREGLTSEDHRYETEIKDFFMSQTHAELHSDQSCN